MTQQPAKPGSAGGPRAAALVAVVAFLAYLPALRAGFVYDDTLLIANNPAVQSLSGLGRAFASHFWQTEDLGSQGIGLLYYRPIVTASFVLNWAAFGGAAWGFHLVNLVLHAVAALLATRLALRWLGRPWLAVLVGVVFALHPTRNESVIWIAGRTDILMTIFGLLGLSQLHRARVRGGWHGTALGLVCLLLALLCKEGAAALPVVMLADAWFDEPDRLSSKARGQLVGAALLTLTYLAVRSWALPIRTSHSSFLPAYGFMTVATYAERLVWPWPQTFFYRSLTLDDHGAIAYPSALVAVGVLLALGYGACIGLAYRRDRAAAGSLLAAGLLIAPVLNFFETGIYVSVSDHFLYLPLLFLLLAACRMLAPRLAGLSDRAFWSGALAFGAVCLVPNSLRARDFKSEKALWQHELDLDPFNPVALEWFAAELAREGKPQAAIALLERAENPAARRQFLLSGKRALSGRHVRRVVLTAAILPDGAADDLRALYEELESFELGKPSGHVRRVRGLSIGVEHGQELTARVMNHRGHDELYAELATLASRLGNLAATRHWLGRLDPARYELLPNPLNVALSFARTGNYDAALGILVRLDERSRVSIAYDRGTLERLLQRLLRARAMQDAAQKDPTNAARLVGQSELELGAYLVACRQLRPAYEHAPDNQELAQLYAQALVAARLDQQATQVVARALGPTQAASVVANLRAALPVIVRSEPPAPSGDGWWRTEPAP